MPPGFYVHGVPPEIALISATSTYPQDRVLPINLLLIIISYIEDVADLARITRTSRLLYYLALPRLYERVTLRAYSSIRYVNDRPEGFGGGSPFSTGLDALISSPNNVAQYVKELHLCGNWKEIDMDDFSKGRIPDNSMILNVAIKAALVRASNLERLYWEMNTKPMKTVYQGIASRSSLSSLKIHFPSSRIPRPSIVIPGIPSLTYLHLANLDPLCYNDDVSVLIAEAENLKTLKLHWSPRMRQEREPSVNMSTYFGRIAASPRKLNLENFAIANLFSRNDAALAEAVAFENIVFITFINCMDMDDPSTVFMDKTWDDRGHTVQLTSLRKIRTDRVSARSSQGLLKVRNLTDIYLVNNRAWSESTTLRKSESPSVQVPPDSTMQNADSAGTSDRQGSNPLSPDSAAGSGLTNQNQRHISRASDFIAALVTSHADTVERLLLRDSWLLGRDVILPLLSSCRKLRQVAFAVGEPSPRLMRECVGAAPQLRVLWLLLTPEAEPWRTVGYDSDIHVDMMSIETSRDEYRGLRWLGLGAHFLRLGGLVKVPGVGGRRRAVRAVGRDDPELLREVDIVRMDSGEL